MVKLEPPHPTKDEVMDPKILNVGDTIEHSSVGKGTVTGFHKDGYPMVEGKAVANVTRTDGAKFGVGGQLALPTAIVPEPVPVAPLTSVESPLAVVQNPGAMPTTTPESPDPVPTPTAEPIEAPAPVEAPAPAPVEPVEAPAEPEAAPVVDTPAVNSEGAQPPEGWLHHIGRTAEEIEHSFEHRVSDFEAKVEAKAEAFAHEVKDDAMAVVHKIEEEYESITGKDDEPADIAGSPEPETEEQK